MIYDPFILLIREDVGWAIIWEPKEGSVGFCEMNILNFYPEREF